MYPGSDHVTPTAVLDRYKYGEGGFRTYSTTTRSRSALSGLVPSPPTFRSSSLFRTKRSPSVDYVGGGNDNINRAEIYSEGRSRLERSSVELPETRVDTKHIENANIILY